jgi:hypothetical protein
MSCQEMEQITSTGLSKVVLHLNPVVKTRHGKVRGSFADGVNTFKGIRYAAAPFEAYRRDVCSRVLLCARAANIAGLEHPALGPELNIHSPSLFRQRRPTANQADQVVAADQTHQSPVEHHRNLGDVLLIH